MGRHQTGADDEPSTDGVNEVQFMLGKVRLKDVARMIFNPIAMR